MFYFIDGIILSVFCSSCLLFYVNLLIQGFQFVTNPNITRILKLPENACHPIVFDAKKEFVLSLGRSFHLLKLTNSQVQVTRYLLRDSEELKAIPYR